MELRGATFVTVPASLSPESVARLCADLHSSIADRDSHVVIMRGDADIFCRGLDLAGGKEEDTRLALDTFANCLESIRTAGKPVIGLVQGTASAGGVGLAAACDAVLATSQATFTLTELMFGMIPAIIFPYLAQRLSPQKLRWIALSAQSLTADDALQAGLVDFVCPPERVQLVLRSWVRRLQRVQPDAVVMWKHMTADATSVSSRQGVQITLDRLRDPQVRDNLLSFIETGQLPSGRGAP
jgi:enoyl-CoA hydratase/carnithine racemase